MTDLLLRAFHEQAMRDERDNIACARAPGCLGRLAQRGPRADEIVDDERRGAARVSNK
jgi:hypothetical protein